MPDLLPFASQAPSPAMPPPRGLLELFFCTGFVGPVLLLLGGIAVWKAIRRWLELRPSAMAPDALQRSLERAVREGQVDQAIAQAGASRTALGDLVSAGLLLRDAGLDEMFANTERAALKESLLRQARAVGIARLGTTILLLGLLGTVTGLMNMMATLARLKAPTFQDIVIGIGESLASTAIGLLFTLGCGAAYALISSRSVTRLLRVREIAEELLVEAARPR